MEFDNQYGNDPLLESLLQDLQRQQSPMSNEPVEQMRPQPQPQPSPDDELMRSLEQRGMTRGLSQGPTGPTFSGPIAGYAGPTRPMDSEFVADGRLLNEKDRAAKEKLDHVRAMGFGKTTVGAMQDIVGAMKGVNPAVIQALISRMSGINLADKDSSAQALALFRHQLGQADRDANRADRQLTRENLQLTREDQKLSREERQEDLKEQRDTTNQQRDVDIMAKAVKAVDTKIKSGASAKEVEQFIKSLGMTVGEATSKGPSHLLNPFGDNMPTVGPRAGLAPQADTSLSTQVTKEQVQELARSRGLDPTKMSKAEITAFVKAAQTGLIKPAPQSVFKQVEQPQPVQAPKRQDPKVVAQEQKEQVKGQQEMRKQFEAKKKEANERASEHDNIVLRARELARDAGMNPRAMEMFLDRFIKQAEAERGR